MPSVIEMVPEARRESVCAALDATFGAKTPGDAQPIVGGVSGAQILRFEVRNRAYVLRLEPERIALNHRQRGFTAMAAAAAEGAAPPVHFADAATGVAIMDFISGRPLSEHPGGPAGMAAALGALIARVQATPPFPVSGDYLEMIAAKLTALATSGLFAQGQLDAHAERLARIRAELPWDAASLVSSHNDPNPRNILFDGQRAWLIDWELAFLNDPLVDIAILTTELVEPQELQDILFEAAFGRAPGRRSRARLSVVRLLTRLFYGCIVLENFTAAPRPDLDASLGRLTPALFRAAVADGRLTSGAPETAYAFAKMSLAAFIDGLAAPGFHEALAMARQG